MKNNNKKGSGLFGGLVFLIIGISLLWWNEGKTVAKQSLILEAEKNLVQIKDAKVKDSNEDKLVAIYGKIDEESLGDLQDSEFGVTVKTAKLQRKVEMYQWAEECEEDENEKETCTYKKVWSTDIIDSSEFKEAGHDNPMALIYENEEYLSDTVKVGDFVIPEDLKEDLSTKGIYKELNEEVAAAHDLTIQNNYYTNVKDNMPEIGNTRISFVYNNAKNLSAIGVQTGDTLMRYTAKKGETLLLLREGNLTGAEILNSMKKMNKFSKWAFRVVGLLLITSAISGLFAGINSIADKVPVLGSIVGGITGTISGLLGFAISLIVVAIAWFRFRPVLSIILLVIVVAIIVALKFLKKPNKK